MRRSLSYLFPLVWGGLLGLSGGPVMGQPGSLDLSFGQNGQVNLDLDDFEECRQLCATPDGRLLVLGNAGHQDSAGFDMDYFVAALLPDGRVDSTFAEQGILRGDFSPFPFSTAADLLLQPDGKFLVLGNAHDPASNADQPVFLTRFRPDGNPDTTFGAGGTFSTHFLGGDEFPQSLELQADGKILLTGMGFDSGAVHEEYPVIARLLPDGRPDSTFGTTGKLALNFATGLHDARLSHSNAGTFFDLALTGDGRIVCAGSWLDAQNFANALVRLLPDGRLDSTFHDGGILRFDLAPGCNNYVRRIRSLPDGSLALALTMDCWYINPDFHYLHLEAGAAVPSPVTLDFAGNADHPEDMIRDGSYLLLAGRSISPAHSHIPAYSSDAFAIARIDADGAWDAGFGDNGQVWLPLGGAEQSGATAMVRQNDGRVVAGGWVNRSGGNFSDVVLIRLEAGNPLGSAPVSEGRGQLQVFPQPASGWVELRSPQTSEPAEVRLYDLEGRLLRQAGRVQLRQGYRLDTENLPAGLYVLKVTTRSGDQHRRLVIE